MQLSHCLIRSTNFAPSTALHLIRQDIADTFIGRLLFEPKPLIRSTAWSSEQSGNRDFRSLATNWVKLCGIETTTDRNDPAWRI